MDLELKNESIFLIDLEGSILQSISIELNVVSYDS